MLEVALKGLLIQRQVLGKGCEVGRPNPNKIFTGV
jgi:hypothetical protein